MSPYFFAQAELLKGFRISSAIINSSIPMLEFKTGS